MELLPGRTFKVKTKDYILSLDSAGGDSTHCFLSHAHSDHLVKTSKRVLCSEPTKLISEVRGCSIDRLNSLKGVKLLNSGHILGSNSLLIDDDGESLLYTGDFSTRDRAFMKGFKPVKCDTLVIESTFGKPYFLFPDYKSELKRAEEFVEDNLKKGYLSVLMGYSLGKSQELQYYFKDYRKSVHEKIIPFNKIYRSFGVDLGRSVSAEKADILFTNPMRSNNNYFNALKRKRGLKFAVFSGWNILPNYKERYCADAGFTISDHADFLELINVVKKSEAGTVYVNHGSSESFTEFLKMEGVNAVSL
jgi:putative mRNA 3-end processing factor